MKPLKANAEYSRNSNANLGYYGASATYLAAAEPQRRRRRVKSRIVNKSRNVAVLFKDEGVSLDDFSKGNDMQREELSKKQRYDDLAAAFDDDLPDRRKYSHSISASLQWKVANDVEEKIFHESSGSVLRNKFESFDLTENPISEHPSEGSIKLNFHSLRRRRMDGSNFSENVPRSEFDILETSSFNETDMKVEYSQDVVDIVCTDEDDETLPPYYQIVPQMFYRFAGISQYSNSTTLQSRADFEKLLKCLAMESLLEEFLVWFPKPKLIKAGCGYISIDMFCELFSCKFAQTILEARWQYETLCSAILTMKCLDKHKLNRIEFVQFLQLYRSLKGQDTKEQDVRKVFDKYDLDGIGQLNIVNIFNFCNDEEDAGD